MGTGQGDTPPAKVVSPNKLARNDVSGGGVYDTNFYYPSYAHSLE